MTTIDLFIVCSAWLLGCWWISEAIKSAIPRNIDFVHKGTTTINLDQSKKDTKP